jgi:hypothetical protein
MKKISIIILFISSLIFSYSCKSQSNEKGLEIYVQNIPHPILTNENPEECYCCVELSKENLSIEPLISDNDIKSFDWKKQKLSLTESGIKKIFGLDFSEHKSEGVPTVIALNGQPIYSLIIFPIGSSVACDRPFAYLQKDKDVLVIHFGVGKGESEFRFGEDPRFDKKLKEYTEYRFENN